jgi:sRNA-binding carbon storage regulator CsrA
MKCELLPHGAPERRGLMLGRKARQTVRVGTTAVITVDKIQADKQVLLRVDTGDEALFYLLKPGQGLRVDDAAFVTVATIRGANQVRLRCLAINGTRILRGELTGEGQS